ncbi:MAG TPA: ABC transporter permease [Candidatus Nanopelagicaceae bacterium]
MRKEILDIRRNRFLILLLTFILVAILISILVSALDFRVKIDAFNNYSAALRKAGSNLTPAPPQLFPLQLLRGSIEYLEILGALFAIVLGYGMVAKEKQKATLGLIFTRPVGRFQLAIGKLLALALTWLVAVMAIFLLIAAVVSIVGNSPLHLIDVNRLLISAALSWIYLLMWSALAMGLASFTRELGISLVVSIVLWLSVVLILPQIGDTMDPDNQVPGGLFNSLQISKKNELAVLANFAGFDRVRNGIEVSSITKHFERSTFAYLGIKDKFNQKPISYAFSGTLPNLLSLLIGSFVVILFAILTTTRKKLLRRQQ